MLASSAVPAPAAAPPPVKAAHSCCVSVLYQRTKDFAQPGSDIGRQRIALGQGQFTIYIPIYISSWSAILFLLLYLHLSLYSLHINYIHICIFCIHSLSIWFCYSCRWIAPTRLSKTMRIALSQEEIGSHELLVLQIKCSQSDINFDLYIYE